MGPKGSFGDVKGWLNELWVGFSEGEEGVDKGRWRRVGGRVVKDEKRGKGEDHAGVGEGLSRISADSEGLEREREGRRGEVSSSSIERDMAGALACEGPGSDLFRSTRGIC